MTTSLAQVKNSCC